MTRIKICGITDIATADLCRRLEVDFIGLVFAASPRQITPERAVKITQHLVRQAVRPEIIGVFVNLPAPEVNRITEYCGLDRVQLSGDEDDDYCRRIERPVIRSVRIDKDMMPEKINAMMTASPARSIYLADTKSTDKYGGTGECFDWNLLKRLDPSMPVMIAGGLNPNNVNDLISRHRPWGVDVSSGVESNGGKDATKIHDFIRAVREAEKTLQGVNDAAR